MEKTEHHKLLGIQKPNGTGHTRAELFLKQKVFTEQERLQQKELKKRIKSLRDRYIAHRINMTLNSDQIGILFLGASHNEFKQYLASDVEVKRFLDEGDYRAFNVLSYYYISNKKY